MGVWHGGEVVARAHFLVRFSVWAAFSRLFTLCCLGYLVLRWCGCGAVRELGCFRCVSSLGCHWTLDTECHAKDMDATARQPCIWSGGLGAGSDSMVAVASRCLFLDLLVLICVGACSL